MTGGTEAGYRKVLVSFYRDARERLGWFKSLFDGSPENNRQVPPGLAAFTTQVHALKSAAATIGAEELSREAAKLEEAGKAGDLVVIQNGLSSFYKHLNEITERIAQALGPAQGGGGVTPVGTGEAFEELLASFEKLRSALEKKDIENVDRLIAEIEGKPLDEKTREAVENISDQVLVTEFEAASATLNALVEGK
jgi:HPt (histidine-containing phosphotransfer) domain-containing protein